MSDAPTEDQRARWLKHPLRKIHYNEVEYIDLCAAITADAVQAERARLAASGEMTDEEVMALVEAHAYRKHDNSFEMTEGEARTLVRALLASERDRNGEEQGDFWQ